MNYVEEYLSDSKNHIIIRDGEFAFDNIWKIVKGDKKLANKIEDISDKQKEDDKQ